MDSQLLYTIYGYDITDQVSEIFVFVQIYDTSYCSESKPFPRNRFAGYFHSSENLDDLVLLVSKVYYTGM